jgi:hypothetical protein
VSWDYGRLVAEVYELDKPVGSTFPALRYYTRQTWTFHAVRPR